MDAELAQICEITGCTSEVAAFHLQAANGDVSLALESLMGINAEPTARPIPAQQPAPSAPRPAVSAASKKIASMHDFPSSDDSDSNDGEKTYSGGEKSGLMMQGPPKNATDLVNSILDIARKNPKERPEEPKKKNTGPVWGTGNVLGNEASVSVVPTATAPAPLAAPRRIPGAEAEVVTIRITFYRNGFYIHGSTFHLYDDPQTQLYLAAFKSGRAPTDLFNLSHDQRCELNIDHQMETDYEVPRVVERFAGAGHSLSAPSVPQVPQVPGAFVSAPASVQPPAPVTSMNPDLPSTTLQIRLHDGTRLVAVFNNTQLVSDVMQFVRLSRSAILSSVLVSGFPAKVLEGGMTLEEAGVLGSVIIERRV